MKATGTFVILLLAGCSTLTVAVDVYKGPLANEARVQTHQAAVMAVGAKPLLIALRDRLEWPRDAERQRQRDLGPYKDGYIPSHLYVFKVDAAHRVNAVLSLYGDQKPELIGAYSRRAHALGLDLAAALRAFNPRLKDEYGNPTEFSDFVDEFERVSRGQASELRQAYLLFFRDRSWMEGKEGNDRKIMVAYEEYRKGRLHLLRPDYSALRDRTKPADVWTACDADADVRYREMAEPSMAMEHAKILIPETKPEVRRQFVDHVVHMARAFGDSRAHIRKGLRTILSFCVEFNSGGYKAGSFADQGVFDRVNRECWKLIRVLAAAKELLETESGLRFLTEHLGEGPGFKKVSHVLTGGSALALPMLHGLLAEIRPPKSAVRAHRMRETMLRRFKDQNIHRTNIAGDGALAAQRVNKKKAVHEFMFSVLRRQFCADPVATALLLLRIDTEAVEDPGDFHGLAVGPNQGTSELEIARQALESLAGHLRSGSGFARGRLDDGLDTLIEHFLAAQRRDLSAGVTKAEQDLFNALIRFAEKVLFIADNQSLLEPDQPDAIRRYTRVLQAIGSSILVQVDELRNRERIREEQLRASETEVVALARATRRLPTQVFAEVLAKTERFHSEAKLEINAFETAQAVWLARLGSATNLENAIGASKGSLIEWKEGIRTASLAQETYAEGDVAKVQQKHGMQVREATDRKELPKISDGVVSEAFSQIAKPVDTATFSRICASIGGSEPKALRDWIEGEVAATYPGPHRPIEHESVWRKLLHPALTDWIRLRQLAARHGPAKKEAEQWQIVLDDLRQAGRKAVLERVGPASDVATAGVTQWEIHRYLVDKAQTATTEEAKAPYARAAARLRPTLSALPHTSLGTASAKNVVDMVIAELRHEKIQALRRGAPESEIKALDAAAEAALEHRGSKIYVRPAASFLRTSYPAATLDGESYSEDSKIQSEIDRQFWQTVNRVNVTGAGNTNFVVTKDDVGNWYVKGYSADPEVIIKSVQRMAMFAAGQAAGANYAGALLKKGNDLVKRAGAVDAPESAAPGPLDRQLSVVTGHYADATTRDYQAAYAALSDLASSVGAAWPAGPPDAATRAQTAADKILKREALAESATTAAKAAEIIEILKAMRLYRLELDRLLSEHPGERKKADAVITARIDVIHTERAKTVADHERALEVIAASFEPAKD